MNYFIYNGIKSSDLGVFIQNKNIFSSPKYDASFVSISFSIPLALYAQLIKFTQALKILSSYAYFIILKYVSL